VQYTECYDLTRRVYVERHPGPTSVTLFHAGAACTSQFDHHASGKKSLPPVCLDLPAVVTTTRHHRNPDASLHALANGPAEQRRSSERQERQADDSNTATGRQAARERGGADTAAVRDHTQTQITDLESSGCGGTRSVLSSDSMMVAKAVVTTAIRLLFDRATTVRRPTSSGVDLS